MKENKVILSPCIISEDNVIVRSSKRPEKLRNESYHAQYDWKTLFYDVFRNGEFIVFQGPPLHNLLHHLSQSAFFKPHFSKLRFHSKIYNRNKGSEIWIKSKYNRFEFDSALGSFHGNVQPSGSDIFEGKRVLLTLSKNNNLNWIADWVTFHKNVHGANAVLFYDNGSDAYSTDDIFDTIRSVCPSIQIAVVKWPFKYGPQGGVSGGVNNIPSPWDSDFCQSGVLQHARFRFLHKAKSVLNCDIDELVVGEHKSGSIFEHTEKQILGLTYIPGKWIGNKRTSPESLRLRKHSDYMHFESIDNNACPNKWCVVPKLTSRRFHTWGVHDIKGAGTKFARSGNYVYRHFKAISNNWKYERAKIENISNSDNLLDSRLQEAIKSASI